ncbi:MAG TPA: hypothetical protein PLG97_08525 [Alcaligenes sp.]|nr:hypothetical protein [Alcaligenes sp.]HRL27550.1 hypothetical protein [Alcaligenes sp.]
MSPERFWLSLLSLALLMGLSIGFTRVITALYAVELGAYGWQLAIVAFAQSIGMLLLARTAARWVDTTGPNKVFTAGSLWGLGICLTTPLFPSVAALALLTAMGSLAMPPRFVSINTIFMSQLETLGKQKAGWFRAAHIIGMTFMGALLATFVFPRVGAAYAFPLAAFIFVLNIAVFHVGIGRHPLPLRSHTAPTTPTNNVSLTRIPLVRKVALWEFAIQTLNAYFIFYIVIIVLRYLHLPETVAGIAVATQGCVFVGTLVCAGKCVVSHPMGSRRTGLALTALALLSLPVADTPSTIYLSAAGLGMGLGLLQIINLTDFADLGRSIGFSQAASINALAGPGGGILGGLLGGLLEPWIAPQTLFLFFLPPVLALGFWSTNRSTNVSAPN